MHGQTTLKLKWMFKKHDGGVDWSGLAQIWNKWQAVVDTETNSVVP